MNLFVGRNPQVSYDTSKAFPLSYEPPKTKSQFSHLFLVKFSACTIKLYFELGIVNFLLLVLKNDCPVGMCNVVCWLVVSCTKLAYVYAWDFYESHK